MWGKVTRNKDNAEATALFWTTVNFEFEYFLNEETDGVLTYTLMNFLGWHLYVSGLSQLQPNIKVGVVVQSL